jgi:hypothetical protein
MIKLKANDKLVAVERLAKEEEDLQEEKPENTDTQ